MVENACYILLNDSSIPFYSTSIIYTGIIRIVSIAFSAPHSSLLECLLDL